jgi:hypothetical protein
MSVRCQHKFLKHGTAAYGNISITTTKIMDFAENSTKFLEMDHTEPAMFVETRMLRLYMPCLQFLNPSVCVKRQEFPDFQDRFPVLHRQ